MPQPDYLFTSPVPADLPVLRRWRDAPQVRQWWPDFDVEIADVERGFVADGFAPRIVRMPDGTPFAWIQDYHVRLWPIPHYPEAPTGARGMDTMIGDPAFLGQGHAPRYIRERATALLAQGASELIVDPDVTNPRAIRTWRAAGFEGDRVVPTRDGGSVLLLFFRGRPPLAKPAAPAGLATVNEE